MASKELLARLGDSNRKITEEDILAVEQYCLGKIEKEDLNKVRNDAKIRAVATTSSYDEFKAIVDAAHLKPLSKEDKQNSGTSTSRWNSLAEK